MIQILKPQLSQGTFTDSYPMDILAIFIEIKFVCRKTIFMWFLGGEVTRVERELKLGD